MLAMFGPIASPLKKRFTLALVMLVGQIGTFAVPKTFTDATGAALPWTTPVAIGLVVLSAAAVLLDRVADSYDERERKNEFAGSESAAEASVSELNSFLREAVEATLLAGDARVTAINGLRRNLVRFAANSIGPGSRATYYTLTETTPGRRCLGDPQHATTVGRSDMPERPWYEAKNPTHEMWRILDQPDSHSRVRIAPEPVGDTDWDSVPYKTFLTIPVKAHGVVFGVLSVNNATYIAIGDAQRAVILALARAMALTLAFDAGVDAMTGGTDGGGKSVDSATLSAVGKDGTR